MLIQPLGAGPFIKIRKLAQQGMLDSLETCHYIASTLAECYRRTLYKVIQTFSRGPLLVSVN